MHIQLTRFLLTLLVMLTPLLAWADDPVAAAVLDLEGKNVSEELTETLTSIVRNEALQVEKYEVVNKFPIELGDVLMMLGCSAESPSCLKQISKEVKARVLIYGVVSQQNSAYKIELNIFDAETGRMLNRLTRTLTETSDPVIGFRREIEDFFEEERGEAMTRLQIGSNVEGAQIRIEDTFVGVVPLERKGLPPGEYDIQVASPEYKVWKKTVQLQAGSDERVWAQLVPIQPEPVADASDSSTTTQVIEQPDVRDSAAPDRVPTTNWGAWSAIVVGGAALAGGAGFGIAMKNVESRVEREADDGTLTQARYQELSERGQNYELAHRVLLGVGAVAAATGVVWLLLDNRGEASAAIGVGRSGVEARVRW